MQTLTPALVLKNFVPFSNKVVLFHKTLGKITCIYSRLDQAAKLCTGSLIECVVEPYKNWYRFQTIDVLFVPLGISLLKLSFIHDVTRLCLQMLPAKVPVYELFDFLWYVYQNITTLPFDGQLIALMRLFLLFDLLSEHEVAMYRCALQDPYEEVKEPSKSLHSFVQICWNRFYEETSKQK